MMLYEDKYQAANYKIINSQSLNYLQQQKNIASTSQIYYSKQFIIQVNMVERHNYHQWKAFIDQIQQSREKTQELSKLYIIIHQKVRKTIQTCTLNPKHNATEQIKQHLQFIKSILLRLANASQDTYLNKINKQTLQKYERHLLGLVDFLRALAVIQGSKEIIDLKQLLAIQKADSGKQFGLKDQLKRSQQRRIRSKSGQRIAIKNQIQTQKQGSRSRSKLKNDNDFNQQNLIRNLDQQDDQDQTFLTKKQFVKEFRKTKSTLENHINKIIQKKGNQLSFHKKYAGNNIEKYMSERKQFENLYFCQDFYDRILKPDNLQKQYKSQTSQKAKNQLVLQSRIFPEFNIKTKFMKNAVKKNILSTVWEAKKQLIQQFHMNNLKKMNEVNETESSQMKNIKTRRSVSNYARTTNESPLKIKLANADQNPRRRRQQSMTNLNKMDNGGNTQKASGRDTDFTINLKKSQVANSAAMKTFRTTWWTEDIQNANRQKLRSTFGGSRFGNYQFYKHEIKY